jgi:hypothetical protein
LRLQPSRDTSLVWFSISQIIEICFVCRNTNASTYWRKLFVTGYFKQDHYRNYALASSTN